MTKDEVLKLAKQFIGDTQNRLFTDEELSAMLARVITQYSFLSQLKTGYADFSRSLDGTFRYPENFKKYKVGFNTFRGIEIAKSKDFIEDYKEGEPEYIYDDNTETSVFSLYPSPSASSDVAFLSLDDYGIIENGEQYGVLPYGGYGCLMLFQSYDYCGGYYYVRECEVEEITDVMALVYGMLVESMLADTEMRNPSVALSFKRVFESRCYAAKNRIATKNRGKKLSGVYF